MKVLMIRDRQGVTNVVSMIMIIAIIVSFMGMVFATYMPAWGKDIEVQTLNEAMDSFMDLKSGLDTLAVGGDQGTTMTTKIALGSDGGPVFGFGRMSGSLNLYEEDAMVVVSDDSGYIYGQGRGSLVYRSQNLYVEDQKITLEGGAIIREQAGSSVVKGPPNLIVDNDPTLSSTSLYILLISLEGQDVSFSGTGSYMVSSTLLSEESSTYTIGAGTDIVIDISTEYGTLWEDTLDGMMADEGLTKGIDYSVVHGTDVDGNPVVTFTFTSLTELVLRSSFFRITMT